MRTLTHLAALDVADLAAPGGSAAIICPSAQPAPSKGDGIQVVAR